MAFNSRKMYFFLAAAFFIRTSSQGTPQGNIDRGKFQNNKKTRESTNKKGTFILVNWVSKIIPQSPAHVLSMR